jgi:hypothetical protein
MGRHFIKVLFSFYRVGANGSKLQRKQYRKQSEEEGIDCVLLGELVRWTRSHCVVLLKHHQVYESGQQRSTGFTFFSVTLGL